MTTTRPAASRTNMAQARSHVTGACALGAGLAARAALTITAQAQVGPGVRFKTCLLQGGVVPLSLDARALAALRKGTALTVNTVDDADHPMAFSIRSRDSVR